MLGWVYVRRNRAFPLKKVVFSSFSFFLLLRLRSVGLLDGERRFGARVVALSVELQLGVPGSSQQRHKNAHHVERGDGEVEEKDGQHNGEDPDQLLPPTAIL